MHVTKSITTKSVVEMEDNFPLIDGVPYRMTAVIVGYNWYNQGGTTLYDEKVFGTQQKPFVLPAEDLEDIFDRVLDKGDFQFCRLMRFELSWRHGGEDFNLYLDADGDIPESLVDYFASDDLIESYYDCTSEVLE